MFNSLFYKRLIKTYSLLSICSPSYMSSGSGQYKIHRHCQEMSSASNGSVRRNEKHVKDVTNVPPTHSTEFTCGITPAIAEAAVRAAPSPSNISKCRANTTVENPHKVFNRGLAPFNSFKSMTTNDGDGTAWRKSQVLTNRNQMNNTTIPSHNYQQVNCNQQVELNLMCL